MVLFASCERGACGHACRATHGTIGIVRNPACSRSNLLKHALDLEGLRMAKCRPHRVAFFMLIALALFMVPWIVGPSLGTADAQAVPTPSEGLFSDASAPNDAQLDTRRTIIRSRV